MSLEKIGGYRDACHPNNKLHSPMLFPRSLPRTTYSLCELKWLSSYFKLWRFTKVGRCLMLLTFVNSALPWLVGARGLESHTARAGATWPVNIISSGRSHHNHVLHMIITSVFCLDGGKWHARRRPPVICTLDEDLQLGEFHSSCMTEHSLFHCFKFFPIQSQKTPLHLYYQI